jgi:hypothetical protein
VCSSDLLKRAERAGADTWAEMPFMWKNEDDGMQTIFVLLEEPGTSKAATQVHKQPASCL